MSHSAVLFAAYSVIPYVMKILIVDDLFILIQ